MIDQWWHLAVLISVQAFWTIFAVSFGVNIVNRSRAAAKTEGVDGPA